jgi:glycolate oxidase iron-sulfur subunit
MIEVGQLPVLTEALGPVAIQDPCHLRHAQRIVEPPRSILRAAGYAVLEIDPSGTCCGAAGVYSLLQPETAAALGERKAAEVLVTEAPIVASANPGCELQLRQYLATAGSGIRVAHPVELYWEALRRARS